MPRRGAPAVLLLVAIAVARLLAEVPSITGTGDIEVAEDAAPFVVSVTVTPDSEGDAVTQFEIVGVLPAGVVSVSAGAPAPPFSIATSVPLTITPFPNANGAATITLRATDEQGEFAEVSFLVTLTPVNDAPTVNAIAAQTTDEDVAKVVTVVAGDPDPGAVLTVTATSSNESIVPAANIVATPLTGPPGERALTITPLLDQNTATDGPVTITVTVDDGVSVPVTTTFTLTVRSIDDPPTASTIGDQVTVEDTPVGPLALTVGDVDNDPAGLLVTATGTTNPALVPLSNVGIAPGAAPTTRNVTVTPAPNQSGQATITLTVSDGTNTVLTAFTLTVTAVNDPPTISAIDDVFTTEDVPVTLNFTIGDLETDPASLVVSATSDNAAVVAGTGLALGGTGAARSVTVTPVANASGSAIVTIAVSDGGATTLESFAVTVVASNDPPTIQAIGPQATDEDVPLAGGSAVTVTVGDVDGDSLTVGASSSDPAVVSALVVTPPSGPPGTRALSITPQANQNTSAGGPVTITVSVSDGLSAPVTTTFPLTINPINDPPTISDIGNVATSQDVPTGDIGFTVGDVESARAALAVERDVQRPDAAARRQHRVRRQRRQPHHPGDAGGGRTGSATVTVTVE